MNSSDNISFDFAHNQTSIDSNGTIKFDANRINLNLLESVAISAVWILLQTFGNGMLIGMILYEREGNGDPLKRRIIDQVMIILSLEGQERAKGDWEGGGECTMLQKLSKCEVNAWLCWNLIILPPLRFYVKSNFGKFKQSKNVIFGNFRGFQF